MNKITEIMRKSRVYNNIIWLNSFLHRLGMQPAYLIFSILLSLGAALFEGAGVAFMIPLFKGIVAADFSFARGLPLVNFLIFHFPGMFTAQNTALFILLALIIFLSALLKNVLQYLSLIIFSWQFTKLFSNLRKLIFARYLSFGKLFFDQSSCGYLQDVLLNFTLLIENNFRDLGTMLNNFFLLLMYMAMMFIISWKLTIFILIIFPVLNYVSNWLTRKIDTNSRFYAECLGLVSKKIANVLTGISLVKLYSTDDKEKDQFSLASDQLQKLEFSIDKKRKILAPVQEIILLVGMFFLLSLTAFMFVRERAGSIGRFMVFFYVLKKAQGVFGALYNIKAAIMAVSGPIAAISRIFDDKDKFFITDGNKKFPGLDRSIEFNHLNFAYKAGLQVVSDVTFSIEKGKLTAIVGPTGSGKTTLINLILRFYDCPPGSVLIDGVDIREFTLKSLMAHVAFVSQDTLLFNDTLRNNIIYGLDGEVAEERIIKAIKQARLYDFIMGLPEGLNTNIGDKGIKLSGGEKQRVSIARALLKGAHILILDEATSSLDTSTERLIQEAIDEAVKDKTAIVIAHRLSTIQNADKVVVIESGRLVEQGSLRELLEKNGKFYEYWQAQRFY